MTIFLMILCGQFLHAILRTSGVRAIASGNLWKVVGLNVASNLVRYLVLTGGVAAAIQNDWRGVMAIVIGQAAGDLIAMRKGGFSDA